MRCRTTIPWVQMNAGWGSAQKHVCPGGCRCKKAQEKEGGEKGAEGYQVCE